MRSPATPTPSLGRLRAYTRRNTASACPETVALGCMGLGVEVEFDVEAETQGAVEIAQFHCDLPRADPGHETC
ncbi:hypothetical protein Psi02_70720 [Planotetraspora silvatica]|uniref:Uncharacterized protein n=1 Tax=Planotetraspora silvatica TaxID=234614 RepID=A0A8J3USR2_9ACTN|nr:hypothetical protein Psi02_70720 [Planotetraspora silvatica]